jgi:intein-encoded DNA endonuclease-like protein
VDGHVSRAAKVQKAREAPSLLGRHFGDDNIDESSNSKYHVDTIKPVKIYITTTYRMASLIAL